jgi:hypothetical protein
MQACSACKVPFTYKTGGGNNEAGVVERTSAQAPSEVILSVTQVDGK